jgi:hypothetical protein
LTEPGGPVGGAIGRQLIRRAEAISQVRKDLDQLASEVTDSVADVLTRMEALEDQSGSAGGAVGPHAVAGWCWRYLGPQGSDALWAELTGWVGWIRNRYPLARRIPECWARHPEVIEELTALWLAWHAAYTERDAPLTGAIDWHDRWLPGVLHRLEHGAFALNCSQDHHDRPSSAYADANQSDSAQTTAWATAQ